MRSLVTIGAFLLIGFICQSPTQSMTLEEISSKIKNTNTDWKLVQNRSRKKRSTDAQQQKAVLDILKPADPVNVAEVEARTNLPPGIGLLPRGEKFSIFVEAHRLEAEEVISYLTQIDDFSTFIQIATYFRNAINTDLWLFAFHVAIQLRPDSTSVRVPPVFELQSQAFFVNGQIDQAAADADLPGTSQIVRGVNLDLFSTSNRRDPESRLAYFREDVEFNFYHWNWHTSNGFFRVKERQGELFYYTHQQILARYDTERLAAGLTRVVGLHEWNKPIVEGYNPDLSGCNGLGGYSPRPANMPLCGNVKSRSTLRLPIPDGENVLIMMAQQRDRISEAIDLGEFIFPNGSKTPVDINNLGQAIEASVASPNHQLYGLIGLHSWGHLVLSVITDPDGRYNTEPGVMFDTRTSNRDPVFYRWHKFVDDLFVKHKATLTPYTEDDVKWNDVFLGPVSVKTTRGSDSVNTLYTYIEEDIIDISRDIYFDFGETTSGPILVRSHHLNHESFKIEFYARRQLSSPSNKATVRVFMAPKYDEIGLPFRFNDQRRLFFEMDKFVITLSTSMKKFTRYSHETTLISQVASTYAHVEAGAATPNNDPIGQCTDDQHCDCGWPSNLLVPKGNAEGQEFDLFVMLTDFFEDRSEPSAEYRPGVSLCGREGNHPDSKPMGFPFDRPTSIFSARDLEAWMNDFGAPNMRATTIKIFHEGFRKPSPDPFDDYSY